ncbi:hypothetical protein SAMD00024442_19_35 [Candidatus Symbiothrix dinenymphae]|nr:hypothetical protein SAMD00024442_19_35 [Candidatus Symbiothrix dinenymphae]
MKTDKVFDLDRFIASQQSQIEYVKEELAAGEKESHWMWFIFPQIDGLGYSATAQYYAIKSLDEAKAYLQHPILGSRLLECCQLLLGLQDKTAEQIFGFPDVLKLKSSMTLFLEASDNPVFQQVLDKYYNGEKDDATLKILANEVSF